jgi:hypothetical protein
MLLPMILCVLSTVQPEKSAPPAGTLPLLLHVTPDGNDANAGDSLDRALKTPTGARNRIRALRTERGGALPAPVKVIIQPGRYVLSEPWVLEPQDSGTEEYPIEYKAAGAVMLSGGTPLSAWRTAELNGKAVWAADLPKGYAAVGDGAEGTPFRSLWIAGERRTWARYPNGGAYATIDGVPEKPAGDWQMGPMSFAFAEADAAAWDAAEGAEVVTFTRWIDSHLRLASVEKDKRLARFERPNTIALEKGDLYIIEGAKGLLDEPGEWWCDAKAGVVYYMPLPGEDPSTAGVVPRLDHLVRLDGNPEKGEFIQHVTLKNIGFAYTRWWFPKGFATNFGSKEAGGPVGFVQAASGAPATVRLTGARNVTLDGCVVFGTESYAISLGRGCQNVTLKHCDLTDLGAGGVTIGETSIRTAENDKTKGNVVEDSIIENAGVIHRQAVGIWIGQSPGNTLRHNRIAELDYTGISIGWTWGYGASDAGGNIVEFNEVAHIGRRPFAPGGPKAQTSPLGDLGGIYTLGTQHGTIIRDNYFHDIAGRTLGWGIYFDEGTTGVLAENNAVLRTSHGGFHQHYGKDNIVRQNLFLLGKNAALWRTRREDHNSFTFSRNVVVGDSEPFLNGNWDGGLVLESNCYWRRDGKPMRFPGDRDLAAWQAAGMDKASVVADPNFTSLEEGDFFPGEISGLDAIGFDPVSVRRVGPRSVPKKTP